MQGGHSYSRWTCRSVLSVTAIQEPLFRSGRLRGPFHFRSPSAAIARASTCPGTRRLRAGPSVNVHIPSSTAHLNGSVFPSSRYFTALDDPIDLRSGRRSCSSDPSLHRSCASNVWLRRLPELVLCRSDRILQVFRGRFNAGLQCRPSLASRSLQLMQLV